jgi:hypothetical protein
MRKTIFALIAAFALTLVLAPAVCQAGEWTGWITDEHCGAKGAKADHKACALKCMDGGAHLVFYNLADQKIYKLDDEKRALENLGHPVKVTGELAENTIKVASIEEAKLE